MANLELQTNFRPFQCPFSVLLILSIISAFQVYETFYIFTLFTVAIVMVIGASAAAAAAVFTFSRIVNPSRVHSCNIFGI